jgi:hypothetical protein
MLFFRSGVVIRLLVMAELLDEVREKFQFFKEFCLHEVAPQVNGLLFAVPEHKASIYY